MKKMVSHLNRKVFHMVGVLCAALMIQTGNAFQYKVGGASGSWAVPNDPNDAVYNQWAEKSRLLIGDTLLFVYDADHDSVLHVTKDNYENCNTDAPLDKFNDGHTVFPLNRSGPFYFISGVSDNCHKNEKLVVVVMADRGKHTSNDVVYSPPASPALGVPPPALGVPPPALGAPPPAPVGGESPPPPGEGLSPPALAPVGGGSPPPPAGEGLSPPSPSPFAEEPPASSTPTNSAISAVVSSIAITAASVGSMLVLAI